MRSIVQLPSGEVIPGPVKGNKSLANFGGIWNAVPAFLTSEITVCLHTPVAGHIRPDLASC